LKIAGDANTIRQAQERSPNPELLPAKARRIPRNDDLEISGSPGDAARVSAKRNQTGPGIDAAVRQVQNLLHDRIESGFYDNEAVLGEIAGKILDLLGL
jgi:hypothetical protein